MAVSTANTPPVLSKSHSFCSPTTITPNSRIAVLDAQHSNNMLLMTNNVHQNSNNSNRSPLMMHQNTPNQHHYPGSNGILKKDPGRTGSVQDILESGGGAGNGISQADLQRARYDFNFWLSEASLQLQRPYVMLLGECVYNLISGRLVYTKNFFHHLKLYLIEEGKQEIPC